MFAVLALIGCEDRPERVSCLPGDAREAASSGRAAPVAEPPGKVVIHLDVSRSMLGYVTRSAGQDTSEYTYVNTLNALLPLIASSAREFGLYKMGSEIQEMTREEFHQAGLLTGRRRNRASPYVSRISNHSNIHDSLNLAVDEEPSTLTIVITDLFLDVHGVPAETERILEPLVRAVRSGRAVGLMGIESWFDGIIYDLPGNPAAVRLNGRRPFYLVMVGQRPRVQWLMNSLAGTLKPYLPGKAVHRGIFSPEVVNGSFDTSLLLREGGFQADEGVKPMIALSDLAEGQQYRFPKGKKGVGLHVDLNGRVLPDTSVPYRIESRARMWLHHESSDCVRGWRPYRENLDRFYTYRQEGGRLVVDLFRNLDDWPYSVRKKTGVMRIDFDCAPLADEMEPPGWVADWNVESADASALAATGPDFYPTLNLRLTYNFLQKTTREGAATKRLGSVTLGFFHP